MHADQGSNNVSFYQGDLSRPMDNPTISWDGYDLVILDPPRTGSLELMDVLGQMRARRILYVSCHPGSLARDAGNLVHTQGYSLAAAGILDMFPQTQSCRVDGAFRAAWMIC